MMALFSAFGDDLPSIALIVPPQFGRVCPVVQCSCDLVVHLLQGGRGGISGSEVVLCSQPFQYFRWNRLCINTVSSRVYVELLLSELWYARSFFPFWQFVGSRLLLSLFLYLLTISVPV